MKTVTIRVLLSRAACVEECLVDLEDHLLRRGIVRWDAVGLQALMQPLGAPKEANDSNN